MNSEVDCKCPYYYYPQQYHCERILKLCYLWDVITILLWFVKKKQEEVDDFTLSLRQNLSKMKHICSYAKKMDETWFV